jgi:DNA-binding protein H-NS
VPLQTAGGKNLLGNPDPKETEVWRAVGEHWAEGERELSQGATKSHMGHLHTSVAIFSDRTHEVMTRDIDWVELKHNGEKFWRRQNVVCRTGWNGDPDRARLKIDKQNAERLELRQKLTDMAKQQGFDIHELFGRGEGEGTVAVKYRDPKNRANTWTGRGRMPRWMVGATKGGKAKKDDFLIG